MNAFKSYFPKISETQWTQLARYTACVREWNERLNLISRKETDALEERHLLPSIAVAKICQFAPGAKILDVGTGGGFPGIPLAILFPKTQFLLIDSIGKKVRAVAGMVDALGLKNTKTLQIRAEELKEKFDFVLGRAVTALPQFLTWVQDKVRRGHHSSLENGILYLKGGDFSQEIQELTRKPDTIFDLEPLFEGQFCQEKCIIYFKKK